MSRLKSRTILETGTDPFLASYTSGPDLACSLIFTPHSPLVRAPRPTWVNKRNGEILGTIDPSVRPILAARPLSFPPYPFRLSFPPLSTIALSTSPFNPLPSVIVQLTRREVYEKGGNSSREIRNSPPLYHRARGASLSIISSGIRILKERIKLRLEISKGGRSLETRIGRDNRKQGGKRARDGNYK